MKCDNLSGTPRVAATLLVAPGLDPGLTRPAAAGAGGSRRALRARAARAPAASSASGPHEHDHGSGLAPGQGAADSYAWLARAPAHRAALAAFRARLAAEGVERVVPLWQLVRTSSSWRQCGAEPFEVAPRRQMGRISWRRCVRARRVVPAVGPVEALSAYRNEALNACSDGAPQSAHRLFFALDLDAGRAPRSAARAMIRDICAAHARDGRAYEAGLGFYSGRRFHVDSNGYRKWGPDGRGASSPCVTGIV